MHFCRFRMKLLWFIIDYGLQSQATTLKSERHHFHPPSPAFLASSEDSGLFTNNANQMVKGLMAKSSSGDDFELRMQNSPSRNNADRKHPKVIQKLNKIPLSYTLMCLICTKLIDLFFNYLPQPNIKNTPTISLTVTGLTVISPSLFEEQASSGGQNISFQWINSPELIRALILYKEQ